jgi:hypothetical protein
LLLTVASVSSAAAAAVPGVTVQSAGSHTITFSVVPAFTLDTLHTTSGDRLRVHVPEGRVRQSASGDHVQWVIEFDVDVSGPTGFDLVQSVGAPTVIAIPPVVERSPGGMVLPTVLPQLRDVEVRYSGKAQGRHMATVSCVIARSTSEGVVLFNKVAGTIQLAPGVNQGNAFGHLGKEPERVQGATALSPVANITLTEEGVHRITAQQMRDAGLPTDADAARNVKVYGYGGRELNEQVEPALNDEPIEQDITVRTNSDGSINEVVFYAGGITGWLWGKGGAEHYIHHYDTDAHYLITTAGGEGRRSVMRSAAPGPAAFQPLTVEGYAFNEEELVNPYNNGSGRKWFGRTVENGGSLVVTLSLPGLVRNGDVRYNANVVHKGSQSGTVSMFENGNLVAQRVLQSVPEYMDMYSGRMQGKIAASALAGDGRSVLRFEYTCSDRTSTGLLDWVDVIYPRGLVADDRRFAFFTDPTLIGICEYSVNGFEGGEIFAFDVTDPAHPQRVQNVAPAGGVATIREQIDSGVVRRYYVASNLRSASLSPLPALTLRSRAVGGELGDFVVITHPDLKASAERYAQYRRTDGDLRVSVVTSEDVMREFGYGTQDPTAFRDFLGYAYRHAPTRPGYVLFWGDGHFDYKGISTTARNYLIPFESLDPDDAAWGLFTHTTEDFFVRLDGNDKKPDMAIGRLPVTSDAIGDRLTEKIRAYEHDAATDDWRTRIALVADDGSTSNGESDRSLHLDQSEELDRDAVPDQFQTKKIYLVEYPTENIARGKRKPSVTAEILSTVNTSGALMLNWIGHGNPRVWAHEFVFERETTPPRMTNSTKPFFVTAATCDFARFDLSDVQSGAEELVLLDRGGAIGIFSSARVVFSFQNAALNEAFYRELFSPDSQGRHRRLGDVLMAVKQSYTSDNDEKFFLLGDPTLRLLIPDQRVVFETVNGIPLTDSTSVRIEALSTVTITGHIEKATENWTDATFNGVATVSLLDGERNVTVVDDDPAQTVNNFTLPGAMLARGSFSVVNGNFTAQFVVPKDIAYSSAAASLFGYAFSEDRRTAMGSSNWLVVDGVSDEQHNDELGPDISIYLDSRQFLPGQVVRANPILLVDLEDATGINATGVGVGHEIEADFDQGAMVEVLTETFSTSLMNPRAGTASKQIFGLGAGEHSVRVRAWDVLNNMQEATTTFRIASADDGLVTSWLLNYPNPFSSQTIIRFQHNANRPFTADVRIYDVQGRMVAQHPMEILDMQTAEFTWDARDMAGNPLGTGVYVCHVNIVTEDGGSSTVSGKLALIR